MPSRSEKEKTGREKLQRIIETFKSIEDRSLDPFLINIDENIKTLREYFPEWETPDDLNLDAEAVQHLAWVIKLQSEWVKHRSTSLYADPFLLAEKLESMPQEKIVDVFLRAWHPIVELEQISLHSLAEAFDYWKSLLPMNERWKELRPTEAETSLATREELVKEQILRDRAFSEELGSFYQELKVRVSERGENSRIHYWDFVGAETYEETVQRAFMTSFLVTYGFATLEIVPLEEEIFIRPYEKPLTKTGERQLVSIPIAVSAEDWTKWKRDELE